MRQENMAYLIAMQSVKLQTKEMSTNGTREELAMVQFYLVNHRAKEI